MKLHQIEDTKVIGIIGLGYVGLPLAVEFGRKRNVIAYDLNAERINSLKEGHDSTLEVSDIDLKTSDLIKFTSIEEDLIDCDIFNASTLSSFER